METVLGVTKQQYGGLESNQVSVGFSNIGCYVNVFLFLFLSLLLRNDTFEIDTGTPGIAGELFVSYHPERP